MMFVAVASVPARSLLLVTQICLEDGWGLGFCTGVRLGWVCAVQVMILNQGGFVMFACLFMGCGVVVVVS